MRIYQAIGQLSPLVQSLEEHPGPHGRLLTDIFVTPLKVKALILLSMFGSVLFSDRQENLCSILVIM